MKKKPKKLPYKEFKKIYNRVPRFCVEIVIKMNKGIVLSKRDILPAKGKWHLPGGTVLFGEKIKDTIDRVAEEETGVRVSSGRMIGIIEWALNKNAFGHSISVVFLVSPTGGKLRGSGQAREIRFFDKIPKGTIKEHRMLLSQNKLL